MLYHSALSGNQLRSAIKSRDIEFGGNSRLKIYGHLHCKSGKLMKLENRVFFKDENEARENGFRPCGNCMNDAYKKWKNGLI
jgi:methylphosphotriester-DNA--protein-cysteine methyltransferase